MTTRRRSRQSCTEPSDVFEDAEPDWRVIGTMRCWLDGEPVWPYEQILATWGESFGGMAREIRRMIAQEISVPDPKARLQEMMSHSMLRQAWVEEFGFAIPCAELLDALAKVGRVIDVGAGSGYFTKLMRNRGIDVTGSDPGCDAHGFAVGRYDPQLLRIGAKTAVRRFPDATVFCSWPTYRAVWFHQMLRTMAVGQRLIVIREECCAEPRAWGYLEACFSEDATIAIPQFNFMHDYAGVYTKQRQRAK